MRAQPLDPDNCLPLLVTPESPDEAGLEALLRHAAGSRDGIERQLIAHGAVLFRGFDVAGAAEFERFCDIFGDELKDYVGGNSPRHKVHGKVYTSTDYPAHLPIPLHNEMSYAPRWPQKLFFFADIPPAGAGETPLGDSRRILAAVGDDVRERFTRRGVMYAQNLHGGWGFGKSWQAAFETDDRGQVERHCTEAGIVFEWRDDVLRLIQVRPAVIEHPITGEAVWFNQADQWHVSAHGPQKQASLLRAMKVEELPRHAYYGDGSAITDVDLQSVRGAYAQSEVAFRWERGDLLVVDNVLTSHGRRPYSGDRRILVAMS